MFIILCVCVTHDICIMLGSSLVFLVFFCYVLIGRKGLSYLFYNNMMDDGLSMVGLAMMRLWVMVK